MTLKRITYRDMYPAKPYKVRDAAGNPMDVVDVHPSHLPKQGSIVSLDDINHPQEPDPSYGAFSHRGSFEVLDYRGCGPHYEGSDLTQIWVTERTGSPRLHDKKATVLLDMEEPEGR